MGRTILNSRLNYGNQNSMLLRIDSYLNQSLRTTDNVVFNDGIFNGNLTVNGTFSALFTDIISNIDTTNNIITLNFGETGSGISSGFSGLVIDRGTATDYQIIFRESDQTVRIGEIGTTQALATREDNPLDGGIAVWDQGTFKFVSTDILNSNLQLSGDNTFSGTNIFSGTNTFSNLNTYNNRVIINNTTNSSNSTTGTLILSGGLSISNTSDASSLINGGSITTAGGVAIAKTLYVGGTTNFSGLQTYTNTTSSINSSVGSMVLSGGISINNSTNATGATVGGSITTAGGVAIAKNLYIGSTDSSNSYTSGSLVLSGGLSINNTTNASSLTSGGTITTGGGLSVAKDMYIGGPAYFSSPVLITNTSSSSSVGTGALTVSGGLGVSENIYYSGTLQNVSDSRVKIIKENLCDCLSKVRHIKPVKYTRKGKESLEIGLIAQEVSEYFPELTSIDEKGYYSLDYARLSSVLIQTIKELDHEVFKLKKEIEFLKIKN